MNPKKTGAIEGLILGITSIILFLDFASIDSEIFNIQAPKIITKISGYFNVSPLLIDILISVDLIVLVLMMKTQRKIGGMSR